MLAQRGRKGVRHLGQIRDVSPAVIVAPVEKETASRAENESHDLPGWASVAVRFATLAQLPALSPPSRFRPAGREPIP